MGKIHLVMPMGGAGTRFFDNGYECPKPLLEIQGKPFFYWATRSIEKYVELESLTFVVLRDHIKRFEIDLAIKKYFPNAEIVVLEQVLNGAVLTCMEGVKKLKEGVPVLFNDCDHIFKSSSFNKFCQNGDFEELDGALLSFVSDKPCYSYLKKNEHGYVTETVEKKVISDEAICGAYYFKDTKTFIRAAEEYLKKCSYKEFFVSGVYNVLAENGGKIKGLLTDFHVPFGTPEEYEEAKDSNRFKELE